MNNKGYFDGDTVMECFFVCLLVLAIIGFSGIVFWFVTIDYPLAKAKRDYMLSNPEKLVVSEWQRGGELPNIPDLNVNLIKSGEDK